MQKKNRLFIWISVWLVVIALYRIIFAIFYNDTVYPILDGLGILVTSMGVYLYCIRNIKTGLAILLFALLFFWILNLFPTLSSIPGLIMHVVIVYVIYINLGYIRYEKIQQKTYAGSLLEFIDTHLYEIWFLLMCMLLLSTFIKTVFFGKNIASLIGLSVLTLFFLGIKIQTKNDKIGKGFMLVLCVVQWLLLYFHLTLLFIAVVSSAIFVYSYKGMASKNTND